MRELHPGERTAALWKLGATARPRTAEHPARSDRSSAGFHRVLVAIDGSGQASDVIALAARAADLQSGRVRVVHVRPWQPALPPSRDDGGLATVDLDLFTESSEQAGAIVEAAVQAIASRALIVDSVVVDAPRACVGSAIVDAGKAWGAEIIVVGRHPRRPFSLLGGRGVSDHVMEDAACAVLVAQATRA